MPATDAIPIPSSPRGLPAFHPAAILGRALARRDAEDPRLITSHLRKDIGALCDGCATDWGLLERAARLAGRWA